MLELNCTTSCWPFPAHPKLVPPQAFALAGRSARNPFPLALAWIDPHSLQGSEDQDSIMVAPPSLSPLSYSFFLFLKKLYVFLFGCTGSSFLHTGFLWCGDRGCSLVAVHGLLPMMASLVGEHGF